MGGDDASTLDEPCAGILEDYPMREPDMSGRSSLTTHLLDVALGRPAIRSCENVR
jgi:hypothetical protein